MTAWEVSAVKLEQDVGRVASGWGSAVVVAGVSCRAAGLSKNIPF